MALITTFHSAQQMVALDVLTDLYHKGHIDSFVGVVHLLDECRGQQTETNQWYQDVILTQMRTHLEDNRGYEGLLCREILELMYRVD